MRFYKDSNHYVVALTCHKVGDTTHHLVLSLIPLNLDVWAWEKYYKHQAAPADTKTVSLQKIDVEVVPTLPTQSLPSHGEGELSVIFLSKLSYKTFILQPLS